MRKIVFSILQTSALPLGYRALTRKSELAGKNRVRKRRIMWNSVCLSPRMPPLAIAVHQQSKKVIGSNPQSFLSAYICAIRGKNGFIFPVTAQKRDYASIPAPLW
jgi:hypothetical protein